eukprot:356404-Chlamydomonas_euryale.AAC.1
MWKVGMWGCRRLSRGFDQLAASGSAAPDSSSPIHGTSPTSTPTSFPANGPATLHTCQRPRHAPHLPTAPTRSTPAYRPTTLHTCASDVSGASLDASRPGLSVTARRLRSASTLSTRPVTRMPTCLGSKHGGARTLAHAWWHMHDGTQMVAHAWWRMHGGTCMVAHAWWRMHGGACMEAHAWWRTHGGACVVAHAWWSTHVGDRQGGWDGGRGQIGGPGAGCGLKSKLGVGPDQLGGRATRGGHRSAGWKKKGGVGTVQLGGRADEGWAQISWVEEQRRGGPRSAGWKSE